MIEYYYEEGPNRFYCKKYLINRSACTTLLDEHEVCERLNNLESQLKEAREELLNYKVKYNNQCSEMNRLKQSRKDQLSMIRKLKEKG